MSVMCACNNGVKYCILSKRAKASISNTKNYEHTNDLDRQK